MNIYCQLRARRALMLFKDILLRTRRALLPSLDIINTLLAINDMIIHRLYQNDDILYSDCFLSLNILAYSRIIMFSIYCYII